MICADLLDLATVAVVGALIGTLVGGVVTYAFLAD